MPRLHEPRYRLPITLTVFVIWIAIVAVAAHFMVAGQTSAVEFVSHGIAWPIVLAAAFLLVVVWLMGWRDVGFEPFRILPTLRLIWLPAIYFVVYATVLAYLGLPPAASLLFIVVNTVFVGLSEELMFRGILFAGLRSRFALHPSIWISCVLFGLVHVLNSIQTGQLTVAALQAVAAFMTGAMLMAIRLRAGSLYASIILHAVWDCLPLLIATHVPPAPQGQPLPAYAYLAPLLVLPNLLYALYLLRPKGLAKIGMGVGVVEAG